VSRTGPVTWPRPPEGDDERAAASVRAGDDGGFAAL
jgi:hypothetical protein